MATIVGVSPEGRSLDPGALCSWVGLEASRPTLLDFPSPGQGSAGSLPELLQAPVGSSILVQCHYRPQDLRARKVWCRFLQGVCQPVVSSVVDRRTPAGSRIFLTDMGGGLLQVEMVTLQEEDAGEYGCLVEGASGPQTVHKVTLDVLPAGELSWLGTTPLICLLTPICYSWVLGGRRSW